MTELSEDLHTTFEVLGENHGGAGWLLRWDKRYDFPMEMSAFHQHEKAYTNEKL